MAHNIKKIKTDELGIKVSHSHENIGYKICTYQQKSNCLSSPEQNYFALFAMRYPVLGKCEGCGKILKNMI